MTAVTPDHIFVLLLDPAETGRYSMRLECLPTCTSKTFVERDWPNDVDCNCGEGAGQCSACMDGDHEACSDSAFLEDIGPECRAQEDDTGCWFQHALHLVGMEAFKTPTGMQIRVAVDLDNTGWNNPITMKVGNVD